MLEAGVGVEAHVAGVDTVGAVHGLGEDEEALLVHVIAARDPLAVTPADDEVVPVSLPARSWSVIDATMDNVALNSIFEYDADAEGRGTIAQAIRQAGWDQVPWVGPDRHWPPMTQVITIVLTAAQWRFAMSRLDESVAKSVDDESVELCSTALAVVRPQLAG